MKRALIPLLVFGALLAALAAGLERNPRELPSALMGRPAPVFEVATLASPDTRLGTEALRGQVWVLNVWASWCTACRVEHPVLVDFARSHDVPVYGLNYKDQRADALRWLSNFGDPYQQSFVDADGRVGMDFGVYGVPETFVIDREGVVRFKHAGALTPEILQRQILPLVRRLRA